MARCNSLVLLLAVFGLSSVATAEFTPFEYAKTVIKMCSLELNVPQEVFEGFVNSGNLPDDKKCFIKCLIQSVQGMDKDGNYNHDSLNRFVPENIRPTIGQCADETNKANLADLCEKSFQFLKCFREKQPEYFKTANDKILHGDV